MRSPELLGALRWFKGLAPGYQPTNLDVSLIPAMTRFVNTMVVGS